MAIRVTSPQPTVGAGAAGGLPPTLEKGINDTGLVNSGTNAKQVAQGILQNLASAGFSAPPKGDLGAKLQSALKSFQQANGLPKTGLLDAATITALKNKGVVENPEAQQAQQKAAQDGFDKAGFGLLKQGEKGRADLVQSGTPDTNFLDALIDKLGPGGPNEGMSAKDVAGAAQAQEAQVNAQQVSEAKKGEGAQKKGSTTDAQKDIELPTNQQLDRGTSSGVKVARGLKSEAQKTEEKRRKNALAGHDPTEAGAEEGDDLEGVGEDGKRRRGKGGDHDGGDDEGEERAGSAGPGDEDGTERDRGNAHSGDEDHANNKRGNASIDDGSVPDAGHYRVPSISEQAFAALDKIQKDASVENRATTYSWDVMFYKPGVYAAGQKAQDLVHLVVESATAFDQVWSRAQANLNVLVRRTDPDGAVPTLDDIIQAIRQARARDGDDTAAKLGKFTRPMGKA